MTPASDDRKSESRNRTPTTTDVSPVRPPLASPAIPTTVPIVSKKSDSMTEITMARAVATPSVSKKPNQNFPTSPKCGAENHECGTSAVSGPTDDHSFLWPQP